jgi:hypothetical protein
MNTTLEIAPHFRAWRTRVDRAPNATAAFERWLFIRVAGVLFEKKAGELLSPPADWLGLQRFEQLRCVAELSRLWGYSYMLLHQSPCSSKVIIYNHGHVRRRLTETPPCILHGELGYGQNIRPVEFLIEIRRRWRAQDQIPHEVGLVLGYPIKDVLGYMGFLPLPYTGNCGWCIYGDPDPSRTMSEECRWAREQALCFLERN